MYTQTLINCLSVRLVTKYERWPQAFESGEVLRGMEEVKAEPSGSGTATSDSGASAQVL